MNQEAVSNLMTASHALQAVMGVQQKLHSPAGQVVTIPWYMPQPGELQHNQRYASNPVITPGRQTAQPSNQLERSLHNKVLAQQLRNTEPMWHSPSNSGPMLLPPFDPDMRYAPLHPKDPNLLLSTASAASSSIKGEDVAGNHVKRKLSKLSVAVDVPNVNRGPCQQHEAYQASHDTERPPVGPVAGNHFYNDDGRNQRSMPPISALLAHGFRNLNIRPAPLPTPTPRSHAFEPWTDHPRTHKTLNPMPVFWTWTAPTPYDGHQFTNYVQPTLPVILSRHLDNPATLVDETVIHSLEFCVPPPEPTFTSTGKQRKVNRKSTHRYEGPDTCTEIRMIRIILPPSSYNPQRVRLGHEVPFTDWIILCLGDAKASTAATNTPSTRAKGKAKVKGKAKAKATTTTTTPTTQQQESSSLPSPPYLLLAFPTSTISDTRNRSKGLIPNSTSNDPNVTTSTTLNFECQGRIPLLWTVDRDASFLQNKWIPAFAKGLAAVEVTVEARQVPCWL